ncbi:MAG: ABC transporter permease [Devosiaceae bacterium]|nr:ABC transporter permease [Devosiaceae bacterium MH13]
MTLVSWLAAVAVCFVLIRLVPGDPVEVFADHMSLRLSPELVAAYRAQWGLDQSLLTQFWYWLQGFVTLDWGLSFATGAPVFGELIDRLGWSLAIGVGGMSLALLVGAGLGFLAAAKAGGLADQLSRVMAIGGQALPAFAVGLIALWLLAAQLQWIAPFGGGTVERLILPVGLVAFFSIGSISRLVRAGFAETVSAPHFKTALSKGLPYRTALWKHGRRRASIALLAGLAPDIAWIVGGTAVAEIIFGVPGLSERVIDAVVARDYPVLQTYVALVALWIIVGLRICAALRAWLEPRPPALGLRP